VRDAGVAPTPAAGTGGADADATTAGTYQAPAAPTRTRQSCALPALVRCLLPSPAMEQGTRVEVRSRFDDRWSRGFEVAEVVDEGDSARYKLKRRSDGSVLPALFVDDELREEKKRSMWWIA
jgi:hypothetical protein